VQATSSIKRYMKTSIYTKLIVLIYLIFTCCGISRLGYATEHDIITLTQNADKGDVKAQTMLGILYYSGVGVERNLAKARAFYIKAAARGNAATQTMLGLMYYVGEGGERNLTKARELFIKAAAQGFPNAQCNLGMMYLNGEGGEQNAAKARELFAKAAAQGYRCQADK
jgi:TPR repeat protein